MAWSDVARGGVWSRLRGRGDGGSTRRCGCWRHRRRWRHGRRWGYGRRRWVWGDVHDERAVCLPARANVSAMGLTTARSDSCASNQGATASTAFRSSTACSVAAVPAALRRTVLLSESAWKSATKACAASRLRRVARHVSIASLVSLARTEPASIAGCHATWMVTVPRTIYASAR